MGYTGYKKYLNRRRLVLDENGTIYYNGATWSTDLTEPNTDENGNPVFTGIGPYFPPVYDETSCPTTTSTTTTTTTIAPTTTTTTSTTTTTTTIAPSTSTTTTTTTINSNRIYINNNTTGGRLFHNILGLPIDGGYASSIGNLSAGQTGSATYSSFTGTMSAVITGLSTPIKTIDLFIDDTFIEELTADTGTQFDFTYRTYNGIIRIDFNDDEITTSTTTTTTTNLPDPDPGSGNNLLIINSATFGGDIDGVTPPVYLVISGSFPVTSGSTAEAIQVGGTTAFSVSTTGAFGRTLSLYKGIHLQQSITVSGSTTTFTSITYTSSDIVKIELTN